MQAVKEELNHFIMTRVSQDLMVQMHDALTEGALIAHRRCVPGCPPGQIASKLGQIRHFEMNAALHSCFEENGIACEKLKGSHPIKATLSDITFSRKNVNLQHPYSKKMSKSFLNWGEKNPYSQGDLFFSAPSVRKLFIVLECCFNGVDAAPETINVCVPHPTNRLYLFREPLHYMIERHHYDATAQVDNALPTLRRAIDKALDKSD